MVSAHVLLLIRDFVQRACCLPLFFFFLMMKPPFLAVDVSKKKKIEFRAARVWDFACGRIIENICIAA